MKKMSKKALSLLLAVIMVVSIIPVGVINASAANGVTNKINSLRSIYIDGRYWNHQILGEGDKEANAPLPYIGNHGGAKLNNSNSFISTHPCNSHYSNPRKYDYDCNCFGGAVQCWGFANRIFYDIFATMPGNNRRYDKGNITIGDQVRFWSNGNNGHSGVVIGRNGNTISVVECNVGGTCRIRWGGQYNIYSDVIWFIHAPNYDSINNSASSKPSPPAKPNAPTVSPKDIAVGDTATISWNAVKNATSYTLAIRCKKENNKDYYVYKDQATKSTSYKFKIDYAREYYFQVTAHNAGGGSGWGPAGYAYGHNPSTVTFKDWDGTVISTQSVKYGYNAVTPTNTPSRKGYTFTGWDKSYNNVKSDLTVTATYKINTYTVKFLDMKGKELKTEKVEYNKSATPPTQTNPPIGYEFVDWNSKDYENVYTDSPDKTITIQGIYQWGNVNLPIVVSDVSATRQEDGYYINFDLTNYPNYITRGRAVVALKTATGKLVDMTESTAFSIPKDTTRNDVEVFVPSDKIATKAEVFVVNSYSSGVPISNNVTVTVNHNNLWSEWQAEEPTEALDKQSRTEYRYRDKQFTTSTATDVMENWTLYKTTGAWSDYSAWSSWSKTQYTGSDSRKVDQKTVTDKQAYTITHWFHYWNGKKSGQGGDWASKSKSGYTRHNIESQDKYYIDKYHNTANYKAWNNYVEDGYAAYAFYDNGKLGWSCAQCGVNGQLYYINDTQSVPAATHKEYRYADRNWITTYHFYKWQDWSDWSTESPAANENREIETRTAYRYIGGSENNSGENRTFEGVVDEELAGRQITLYVYGYIGASDFTNYYIGQSVIREDGSYSFNYKLREEPSKETGDFTIAIGIEGTNDIINVGTIKAPKPTYDVNFYDFNGNIIKHVNVEEGDSVDVPALEAREGYYAYVWSESTTNVKSDLDVYPKDDNFKKQCTVTFIDFVNDTYETIECNYGDTVSTPIVESTEAYDFLGWESIVDGETAITDNMVVTAQFEKKEYTVKFYDVDKETVIDTQTIEYGESATVPDDLSEGELMQYGWEALEENADYNSVKQDMNVVPIYVYKNTVPNPTSNLENGVYTSTQTVTLSVDDDDAVIYYTTDNTEPKMSSTAQRYTGPITIDSTTTLSYYASAFEKNDSETVTNYYCINDGTETPSYLVTIKYNDVGGEHISSTVPDGTSLAYEINQIVKENDTLNITPLESYYEGYNLKGVYSDKELTTPYDVTAPITNSIELFTDYEIIKHTVTFQMPDGTVIDTQQVDHWHSAEPPKADAPDGYVFAGWDGDCSVITNDVTLTAKFLPEDEYATISLNKTLCKLLEGSTLELVPTIVPDALSEEEIDWSTSDNSVATVDDNGKVTAISAGSATITATVISSGESASCEIEVIKDTSTTLTLKPTSSLEYDSSGNIRRIVAGTTVSALKEEFENIKLSFVDKNGKALSDDDKVTTGTTVNLIYNNNILDSKTIVITGDSSCDGVINNRDVVFTARVVIKKQTADDIQLLAMDVNGDGKVNNRDVAMLARYLVGKETIA